MTSTFAAARSAAAHGDDFTAFLRLHTLISFFAFAPFSILIEDPEGNMVRSVDIYTCDLQYTIMRIETVCVLRYGVTAPLGRSALWRYGVMDPPGPPRYRVMTPRSRRP